MEVSRRERRGGSDFNNALNQGTQTVPTPHKLTYAVRRNAGWVKETVFQYQDPACAPGTEEAQACLDKKTELRAGPILIDSAGRPHILYSIRSAEYWQRPAKIFHAVKTAFGWITQDTTVRSTWDADLLSATIDGSDAVHLATITDDFAAPALIYARGKNGQWTVEAGPAGHVASTSIGVDRLGRAVIAISDHSFPVLYRRIGPGQFATLPASGLTAQRSVDLAINPTTGDLHLVANGFEPIGWSGESLDGAAYARFRNGSWSPRTLVTADGTYGSVVALDGSKVHVVVSELHGDFENISAETSYFIVK